MSMYVDSTFSDEDFTNLDIYSKFSTYDKRKIFSFNGIFVLFWIEIQGQCSGGIWPIQDETIGSFNISWRYNIALNTVQFLIQGKNIFLF